MELLRMITAFELWAFASTVSEGWLRWKYAREVEIAGHAHMCDLWDTMYMSNIPFGLKILNIQHLLNNANI